MGKQLWYNSVYMATNTITVTSEEIVTIAQTKAAQSRMSVAEYVSRLIIRDKRTEPEHIPAHVAKRWKKEWKAFVEEDRKHPRPTFTSAREMVEYIRRQP